MKKMMVFMVIFMAVSLKAQQTYSFQGEMFMLPEFMAMIVEDNGKLVVNMAMPAERRPKAYREYDLKKDDAILFFNKKRVREVAVLEEKYNALAVGDTVMLGIRRGEGDMFILRFPKVDPEKTGMRIVQTVSPGGLDMNKTKMLSGEGLLLTEAENRVRVMAALPQSQEVLGIKVEKDDWLLTINGDEVVNVKMVESLYDAIKVGESMTLEFERGDEILKATFKKPEPRSGSVMIEGTPMP